MEFHGKIEMLFKKIYFKISTKLGCLAILGAWSDLITEIKYMQGVFMKELTETSSLWNRKNSQDLNGNHKIQKHSHNIC